VAEEVQDLSQIGFIELTRKPKHQWRNLRRNLSRNEFVFLIINIVVTVIIWLIGDKLGDTGRKALAEPLKIIALFWVSLAFLDAGKTFFFSRDYEHDKIRILDEATTIDGRSANSGGYIVMDMPENEKRMFHDVLKGFEEFALLKGYSVSFSLDGSVPDKVAFKFTILDRGVSVSTKKVQADLKDYIARVQNGDSLDDLPTVLPDAEHAALVLVMRNRINFLQHTYNALKNVVEFYERILHEGGVGNTGLVPAQNFYLQGGGSMASKTTQRLDQAASSRETTAKSTRVSTLPNRISRRRSNSKISMRLAKL